MPETFGPIENLNHLIATGRISVNTVSKALGVTTEQLDPILRRSSTGMTQANGDSRSQLDLDLRISILAAQLTHGLEIEDDERLTGIVESLLAEFEFTEEGLAAFLGVDPSTISAVLVDAASVDARAKYSLAVKGLYLVAAFNQARPR